MADVSTNSVRIFLQPPEMELAAIKVVGAARTNGLAADICAVSLLLINCVPTRAPLIAPADDDSQPVMRIDWGDNSALEYVSLNASRFHRVTKLPMANQRASHRYAMSYLNEAQKKVSPTVDCLWLPGLSSLRINEEFDAVAQCERYDRRTALKTNQYPKAIFSNASVYWVSPTVGFATWLSPVNPKKVASVVSSENDNKVAFLSAKDGRIHPRIVAVYAKEKYIDPDVGYHSDIISDTVVFNMKDGKTLITAAIESQFPSRSRPEVILPTVANYDATAEPVWLRSLESRDTAMGLQVNHQQEALLPYSALKTRVVSIVTILLGRADREDAETSFLTIISATSWGHKYCTFNVTLTTATASNEQRHVVFTQALSTNPINNRTATIIWSTKLVPDDPIDVDYSINFKVLTSQSGSLIVANTTTSGPLRLPSDLETNWHHVHSLNVKEATFEALIFPRTEDMASFLITPASCLSHTLGVYVNGIMLDPQDYKDTDIDLLSVVCEPLATDSDISDDGSDGRKDWCMAENSTVTVKVSCL